MGQDTFLSWAWLSCKLLVIEEHYKSTRSIPSHTQEGNSCLGFWTSPDTPLSSEKEILQLRRGPCSLHGQLLCAWDSHCSRVLSPARQRVWQLWTSPQRSFPRGVNSLFVEEAFPLSSTSGETEQTKHKHTEFVCTGWLFPHLCAHHFIVLSLVLNVSSKLLSGIAQSLVPASQNTAVSKTWSTPSVVWWGDAMGNRGLSQPPGMLELKKRRKGCKDGSAKWLGSKEDSVSALGEEQGVPREEDASVS